MEKGMMWKKEKGNKWSSSSSSLVVCGGDCDSGGGGGTNINTTQVQVTTKTTWGTCSGSTRAVDELFHSWLLY